MLYYYYESIMSKHTVLHYLQHAASPTTHPEKQEGENTGSM